MIIVITLWISTIILAAVSRFTKLWPLLILSSISLGLSILLTIGLPLKSINTTGWNTLVQLIALQVIPILISVLIPVLYTVGELLGWKTLLKK